MKILKALNNNVYLKRDAKPEFTESGIALPETQYVAPDWVTIVEAPSVTKDRFGERQVNLLAGTRAFVRPSAGYKDSDLDKLSQRCHHSDVIAIDDKDPTPYDHYVFIKKPQRAEKVSLIIIPETVTSLDTGDNDRGEIVKLGSNVAEDLSVGTTVIFDPDQAVTIDKDQRLFAIPEDGILMVIENG